MHGAPACEMRISTLRARIKARDRKKKGREGRARAGVADVGVRVTFSALIHSRKSRGTGDVNFPDGRSACPLFSRLKEGPLP